MNFSDTSFLLHYRKDCEERLQNLKIVIQFYKKHCKNAQFIVVEDNNEFTINNIDIGLEKKDKIFYLKNSGMYVRPLCYNIAAELSDRKAVIAIDTDVIINPVFLRKSLDSCLKDDTYGMFLPYNGISLYTKEHVKEEFIKTYDYESLLQFVPDKFMTSYQDKNLTIGSTGSVGGAFVFSKKQYDNIGGFNPNFIGWGYEDNELMARIQKLDYRVGRVSNEDAWLWHLNHPNAIKSNNPHYENNRKINILVSKMNKDEIRTHINSWKNPPDRLYANFLKGKKVAIVGPAPHIIGSKQQEKLDSYDVVVRINKALPIPKNLTTDIGTKTDVLYNCLNPSEECGGIYNVDLWKKEGAQWVVCPYPPIKPFDVDIKRFQAHNKSLPFRFIATGQYKKLADDLKTRPNSGYLAIIDLLRFDIKELYITGFSFFKGGYYSEYRNKNEEQVMNFMANGCGHKQEPQIEHFKNLVKQDKRITTDKYLKDLIEGKIK